MSCVVQGLAFPITCDVGDSGDHRDPGSPPPMPQLGFQKAYAIQPRLNPGDIYFTPGISNFNPLSPSQSPVSINGQGSPFRFRRCRAISAIPAIRRAPRATPPPFFRFCCKQSTYPNRRLGDAWVALAWPLGDAWVTQGSPNPKPNPNQAEGRNASPNTKYQKPKPKTTYRPPG